MRRDTKKLFEVDYAGFIILENIELDRARI
jgi:hypothetical protein